MKIVQLAAKAGMLAALTVATAQTKHGPPNLYSASHLIRECRAMISDYDSDRSKIGANGQHCLGYVQGFIETATMWQVANAKSEAPVPMYCLHPKASNEVIIRKIPIWAIEHPENAKGSAIEFLISMLVGNYPCSK